MEVADLINDVAERIISLGYDYNADNDEWLAKRMIKRVITEIKNYCNITKTPCELHDAVVDTAAGLFLSERKDLGQLPADTFNFDAAIKSLSAGDTNITFAAADFTPEERFDALVCGMLKNARELYRKYKRISWGI